MEQIVPFWGESRRFFGTVTVGRGERQHPTPHPQNLLLHPFPLGENPGKTGQKLLPLPRHHAKALTKHFLGKKKPFLVQFPAWGRALPAAHSQAILGSFFWGGESSQSQSSPSPFHPWNSPFWSESGTNTNFWLPTVPADPFLGFFCPILALGGSSGGGRAGGGCKKHPRDPPQTHPVSTTPFFGGGKAAGSVKPPEGRGFFRRFRGGLGSGGAHMPRPGGSPRSPRLPTPQNGRNRPKSAALPPPPRAGPGGGSGWGGARPVPAAATADLGGFGLKFEAPPPSLAPTLTRFWGQKAKFKHSCSLVLEKKPENMIIVPSPRACSGPSLRGDFFGFFFYFLFLRKAPGATFLLFQLHFGAKKLLSAAAAADSSHLRLRKGRKTPQNRPLPTKIRPPPEKKRN